MLKSTLALICLALLLSSFNTQEAPPATADPAAADVETSAIEATNTGAAGVEAADVEGVPTDSNNPDPGSGEIEGDTTAAVDPDAADVSADDVEAVVVPDATPVAATPVAAAPVAVAPVAAAPVAAAPVAAAPVAAAPTGSFAAPIPPTILPPVNLTDYVIEPYFYSNDPNTQVLAYHFCQNLNSYGVIQCTLYDGRDPATSRLLGIEYVVNETVFNSLPPAEQVFWHSHAYAVQSGNIIAPEATGADYTNILTGVAASYGKSIYTWSATQQLPLGDPTLLFAFTADGQFNAATSQLYDTQTNTTVDQRKANNANVTIPAANPNADIWAADGVIPIFDDSDQDLPAGLWGLTFPAE